MKYFIYVIIVLAIALIGFNFTFLDFDSLFEGESMVALISVLAGLCVLVLMIILLISRSISNKYKR